MRVSKARGRDDLISPEVQRAEIERYAVRQGLQVSEWFEDLDISGRTDERPGLRAMLEAAQAGLFSAVVVYRLDRFSREPRDFYEFVFRLTKAGVDLHDAGETAFADTPEAELMRGIKILIAKQESVNTGKRLQATHRRLAEQARWSGGPPPFGFQLVRDENGSRLVADPEERDIRLWIHDRYHHGWGAQRIARDLNRRGVPTQRGRTWERATVEAILFRSIQVGAREVEGELVFGGNIEAIVPLETYEKTLAIHEARRRKPQAGKPPRVSLTGRHVRCGTCGRRLYARSSHSPPSLYYSCNGRTNGVCDNGPAIQAEDLLEVVEERLFARLHRAQAPRQRPTPEPLTPLREAVEQAEQALGRLATMYANGELLEAEYRSARELQLKRLQKAEERLKRAATRSADLAQGDAIDQLWEDLGGMTRTQWGILSVQAQRDVYDLLLDRVVVYPLVHPRRRKNPEKRRVEVYWR